MRLIPIKELKEMELGEQVPSTKGEVKSVFKLTEGDGQYGHWTCQKLILAEAGTEIQVNVWNQAEIPREHRGRVLYFEAQQGDKGLSGLSIKEEDYRGAKKKVLHVTQSARVSCPDVSPPGPGQAELPAVAAPSQTPAPGQVPPLSQAPSAPPRTQAKPPTGPERILECKREAMRIAGLWKIAWAAARQTRIQIKEETGEEIDTQAMMSCVAAVSIKLKDEGWHNRLPDSRIDITPKS